jgi:hypothetical protein
VVVAALVGAPLVEAEAAPGESSNVPDLFFF